MDFGEYLRRHALLHLVQDLELAPLGQRLGRGKLAPLEIAADARILVIKQVLVGPLEVVGETEGLPHAAVLKLREPNIENEELHGLGAIDGNRLTTAEAAIYC